MLFAALSLSSAKGLAGGKPCPIPLPPPFSASPGLSFPGGTLRTETQPLGGDVAFQICQVARQLPDVVSGINDRSAPRASSARPQSARDPSPSRGHCACSALRTSRSRGRFFGAPARYWARLPGGASAMALLVGVAE